MHRTEKALGIKLGYKFAHCIPAKNSVLPVRCAIEPNATDAGDF